MLKRYIYFLISVEQGLLYFWFMNRLPLMFILSYYHGKHGHFTKEWLTALKHSFGNANF